MRSRRFGWFRGAQGFLSLSLACGAQVACTTEGPPPNVPKPQPTTAPDSTPAKGTSFACARKVVANVVAIDQPLMFNRMGAGQPNGMMYALERDVVPARTGTKPGAGNAMLRPDKRPRPIVLRAAVGDCLTVHFTNWLSAQQPPSPLPPPPVPSSPDGGLDMPGVPPPPAIPFPPFPTLAAGITVMGLDLLSTIKDDGTFVGANPNSLAPACAPPDAKGEVASGCSATYSYAAVEEGTYFLYSSGAAVTLPGAIFAGQLTEGLFGAVNVEPKGSSWYRSQVTRDDLAKASRPPKAGQKPGEYLPVVDYEATVDGTPDGVPVLNMLHRHKDASGQDVYEIVHTDLTAVITGPNHGDLYDPKNPSPDGPRYPDNPALPERWQPFREITTIYHDDLITTQAFAAFLPGQPGVDLSNVLGTAADLFAINYGIGGIAAEVYANRVKVGPAAECVECKFEEFFLSSWAGGDPATLVDLPAGIAYAQGGKKKAKKAFYPDDPSNVYHSYLNDHVRFRLLHGGASIPHMHHLHAHQWLYAENNDESAYLDSQAIGPGSAHTLEIAYGGTGNRNRTPGDSIFHCHFYPHFASGMWALWRSHDVFEWGTELKDGVPRSGARALPDGEIEVGTPIPAIVPLPALAMPPLPAPVSLTKDGKQVVVEQDPAKLAAAGASKNPGFPFYIPGIAGHRPPHPPMDFAVGKDGKPLDGGLPRHIVRGGTADSKETPTDFSKTLKTLDALELPEKGTAVEAAAMEFHAQAEHKTVRPDGSEAAFKTNGKKPAPGAPFADPCGDWTAPGDKEVTLHTLVYQAAAFQMDVTFNKKGWHFPQERITALWQDVDNTLDGARPPEPFVFRADSKDCIEYQHTNVVPNVYNQDDFQIQTPTDILGQHIHLVKFDVTSSDGAENGWNYEDGTFSMDEVVERIDAIDKSANKGLQRCVEEKAGVCVKYESLKLAPTTFQFPTDPKHPARKPRKWKGAQTTVQRWWADPLLDNPKPGRPATDRTLRTVFTHDHFGPSTHQQAGLYAGLLVEPTGAVWFDPVTGERMSTRQDGGPTSWEATIEPSGGASFDAYREFALLSQNTQLSYKKGKKYEKGHPENALNPPATPTGQYTPDMITAGQMSGGAINYRNEPIPFRVNGTGKDADPHAHDMSYVFSSIRRGDPDLDSQPPGTALSPGVEGTDPFTPVLRAYQGDNVQVRTLIGAQADHNVIMMHGVRWFFEPSNKLSGYRNSQTGGISEHFEFLFSVPAASPGVKGDFADMFYSSNAVDSGLANGVWGLLRAYKGKQQDGLKALSNNPDLGKKLAPEGCPEGAPERKFEVVATSAKQALPGGKLVYYSRGGAEIADENALVYVLKEDLQNGKLAQGRKVEPLVLRARAGECVKVTLENQIDSTLEVFKKANDISYSAFTAPTDWSKLPVFTSKEVGLHPQLVSYDVTTADGLNAGFNQPQTAGPREGAGKPWKTVSYQWYAGKVETGTDGKLTGTPVEFGAVNLFPSDPLGQHPHGMVGALVVEPAQSRWDEDAGSRLTATVYPASGAAFREVVLLFQEEIPQPQQGQGGQQNYAFSYGTEPLEWRYGTQKTGGTSLATVDLSCALSDRLRLLGDSQSVGDPVGEPQTPILVASAGSPVRFRVLHAGADEGGLMAMFTINGHRWQDEPFTEGSTVLGFNPTSDSAGIRTTNGPTDRFDVLLPSAGGVDAVPGDYLYRSFTSDGLAGGLWGVFRVAQKGKDAVVITNSTDKAIQGVVSVFPGPTGTGPVKTGQYAATVTLYKGDPTAAGDCSGAALGPAVQVGPGGAWTFTGTGLSAKEHVCAKSAGGGVAGWLPYSELPDACGQPPKIAAAVVAAPREIPPHLLRQIQIGRRKGGLKQKF